MGRKGGEGQNGMRGLGEEVVKKGKEKGGRERGREGREKGGRLVFCTFIRPWLLVTSSFNAKFCFIGNVDLIEPNVITFVTFSTWCCLLHFILSGA